MYRRDISPLLAWIGLTLFLLVGIHRLYPSFAPSLRHTPLAHEYSTASESGPVEPPPPLVGQPTPPFPSDVPTTRRLDWPPLPLSPYEVALAAIRDDIEAHRFLLAERKLLALPTEAQRAKDTRTYLAILWNNLGIEQELTQGTEGSLPSFKRAASLDDSNSVILKNLAHAAWEQRDPALNQELLDKLISTAPSEPFPYVALADWLQERGRFDEAKLYLSRAADRIEREPTLRSYLALVAARVEQGKIDESSESTPDSAP
jgi:tetratricopeptide (TPR) repeat protein